MNADCIKLTSYFGERHRANRTFVADGLVDLYGRNDIAASIVLRGIQGFGLKHHLRTDRSLSLSEDLPMTAIAVDTRPNIDAVLDQTLELNLPGLVRLEPAQLLSGEIEPAGIVENAGESTKLTVYFGRHNRVYGVPAAGAAAAWGTSESPATAAMTSSGRRCSSSRPTTAGTGRFPAGRRNLALGLERLGDDGQCDGNC